MKFGILSSTLKMEVYTYMYARVCSCYFSMEYWVMKYQIMKYWEWVWGLFYLGLHRVS